MLRVMQTGNRPFHLAAAYGSKHVLAFLLDGFRGNPDQRNNVSWRVKSGGAALDVKKHEINMSYRYGILHCIMHACMGR